MDNMSFLFKVLVETKATRLQLQENGIGIHRVDCSFSAIVCIHEPPLHRADLMNRMSTTFG